MEGNDEMETYGRNARVESESPSQEKPQDPKGVRVNGYHQIIEMFRVADQEFRKSLLVRLERQDPSLAVKIRKELERYGIL